MLDRGLRKNRGPEETVNSKYNFDACLSHNGEN